MEEDSSGHLPGGPDEKGKAGSENGPSPTPCPHPWRWTGWMLVASIVFLLFGVDGIARESVFSKLSSWVTIYRNDANFRGVWSLPDEEREMVLAGIDTMHYGRLMEAVSRKHLAHLADRYRSVSRGERKFPPSFTAAMFAIGGLCGAAALIPWYATMYRRAAIAAFRAGDKATRSARGAGGAARRHIEDIKSEARK